MCKFIQRGSMLCMSVFLIVFSGVLPVQAQENPPGIFPDKICYTETVKIERCISGDGWKICIVQEETRKRCIG